MCIVMVDSKMRKYKLDILNLNCILQMKTGYTTGLAHFSSIHESRQLWTTFLHETLLKIKFFYTVIRFMYCINYILSLSSLQCQFFHYISRKIIRSIFDFTVSAIKYIFLCNFSRNVAVFSVSEVGKPEV